MLNCEMEFVIMVLDKCFNYVSIATNKLLFFQETL